MPARGRGRPVGSRSKRKKETIDRLINDLKFDPLEALVAIAKGQAEKVALTHPFLQDIEAFCEILLSNKSLPKAVKTKIDVFLVSAREALIENWVPFEWQMRAIFELMPYVYPKLKAHEIKLMAGDEKTPAELAAEHTFQLLQKQDQKKLDISIESEDNG